MQFVFLPGASGNREFWQPVSELLADLGPRVILGWPGLGGVPARPDVSEFEDVVRLVIEVLGPDVHVVAQSMGTVVAMKAALVPGVRVASLTLVAPSGGLDVQRLGANDWREGAPVWHPKDAPGYFFDEQSDLSQQLQTLRCRTLVISGDSDPLSPVSVGNRIVELIPTSELLVVPTGDHDVGLVHAPLVAASIRRFVNGV